MPISVSGTSITFNDNTTQTTAASGIINQSVSVYNSPGTFTTPANTTRLYLVVCSAGGGGGGHSSGGDGGPGGDGGSAIIGAGYYPVTASTPYPITVGSGGNGGAQSGNVGGNGNSGGSSSFGSLLTCNGGAGGNGGGPSTPGNQGAIGTSPLAQVTVAASNVGRAVVFSNTAGGGGPGGNNSPGSVGVAGRVLVYF